MRMPGPHEITLHHQPARRRDDAVGFVRPTLPGVGVGVRVQGCRVQRVPAQLPDGVERSVGRGER